MLYESTVDLFIAVHPIFLFAVGCKKEISCEGCQHSTADGTINCDSMSIHGNYDVNAILTDSNYATLSITVATSGAYTIYSDTVNGFYFYDSGNFKQTGLQQVILKAKGRISANDTSDFKFHFGNAVCTYKIAPPPSTAEPSRSYSFIADGVFYSGVLDSAYLTYQDVSGNKLYGLSFRSLIVTPADTVLSLAVGRINMPVTTGTYHSALFTTEDFAAGINFSFNNQFIYGNSPFIPAFQVILDTYGRLDRLVKGTFSGPVVDGQNRTINISNGKFKTYLIE